MTAHGTPFIPDVAGIDRTSRAIAVVRHGFIGLRWKRWARAIITIRATPKQIALGVALGSFIAFTPLVGIQMLLAALAAALLGASRKAAVLAVWISNPMTMGPIFALTYHLGRLLGEPNLATASVVSAPGHAVAGTHGVFSSGMTIEQMIQAGWGIVLPMFLGGAVIGLIAALIAYNLTHRAAQAYQTVPPTTPVQ